MTLKLHMHPFASFCQKVLIAFYENETAFEPVQVDLGDEASRSRFTALWPMTKMPVLVDEARGLTIPEATIIIEYLDVHHPGRTRFVPADPDLAWRVRLCDRIYDHYVQGPLQKIVGDRLRTADTRDRTGVAAARAQLRTAYGVLERDMSTRTWAAGEHFSLADCAAAPALFYAAKVEPFADTHPQLVAYFERLSARPSFARVVDEARPLAWMFPQES